MYEGKNENAPKIGRWCGERPPLPYTSLGNEILIVFHTDWSYEADGFRLKYETGKQYEIFNSPDQSISKSFYVQF